MKYFISYILLVYFSFHSHSQINELGVFGGGINYIGDVGPTDYINPNKAAIGIVYKWNRSSRHSYRFSYFQGNLTSNDVNSNVPSRFLRGITFQNKVKEFSTGMEFNFLDFDLHDSGPKFSPYLYSGLSYFIYDEIFILDQSSRVDYQSSTFAIPMTLGVKARLFEKLIIAAEIGLRYTFTDNLDGSNPVNDNFESLRFGNKNSNDWYTFSGITLTYTFGQNPCFCVE